MTSPNSISVEQFFDALPDDGSCDWPDADREAAQSTLTQLVLTTGNLDQFIAEAIWAGSKPIDCGQLPELPENDPERYRFAQACLPDHIARILETEPFVKERKEK